MFAPKGHKPIPSIEPKAQNLSENHPLQKTSPKSESMFPDMSEAFSCLCLQFLIRHTELYNTLEKPGSIMWRTHSNAKFVRSFLWLLILRSNTSAYQPI